MASLACNELANEDCIVGHHAGALAIRLFKLKASSEYGPQYTSLNFNRLLNDVEGTSTDELINALLEVIDDEGLTII